MHILKMKTCPAGMLSEYVIGKVTQTNKVKVDNPVRVFEYMVPNGGIVLNYTADTLFSLDSIELSPLDVLCLRELASDEGSVLDKYNESLSKAKMAKAGLLSAGGPTTEEIINGKK